MDSSYPPMRPQYVDTLLPSPLQPELSLKYGEKELIHQLKYMDTKLEQKLSEIEIHKLYHIINTEICSIVTFIDGTYTTAFYYHLVSKINKKMKKFRFVEKDST